MMGYKNDKPIDGQPDRQTFENIKQFQKDTGLPVTGKLDPDTYYMLERKTAEEWKRPGLGYNSLEIGYKVISKEALKAATEITASFEGGSYSAIAGNFDNQGLSFGLVQWNIGQGTLQPLLREMAEKHPEKLREIFGDKTDELLKMLNGTKEEQLDWAKSINTPDNKIENSWKSCFIKLGQTADFQEIQRNHLSKYYDKAFEICNKYGLKSEVGFALAYDIAIQNGSVKSKAHVQIQNEIDKEQKKLGRELTEKEKMQIIANAVADHSTRAKEDVRNRKMTIINQQGTVHGKRYDLKKEYDLSYEESWKVN